MTTTPLVLAHFPLVGFATLGTGGIQDTLCVLAVSPDYLNFTESFGVGVRAGCSFHLVLLTPV